MEDGYHKDVLKKHANINPTPYKISTITATGDINAHIQLDVLFAEIPLAAKAFASSTWGFSSAQFSTDGIVVRRSALDDKGEPLPVQKSSRRKRRPTRHFDNQCTLINWELDRKKRKLEDFAHKALLMNEKVRFLDMVIDGSLCLHKMTTSSHDEELAKMKLATFNGDYKYLTSMPMSSLTVDRKVALEEELKKTQLAIEELEGTTPIALWAEDLNALESKL